MSCNGVGLGFPVALCLEKYQRLTQSAETWICLSFCFLCSPKRHESISRDDIWVEVFQVELATLLIGGGRRGVGGGPGRQKESLDGFSSCFRRIQGYD